MSKSTIFIICLALGLFCLTAVAGAMPADTMQTIKLDEQNNGKTITVNQFDLVEINLAGNPTTGYIWQITGFNPEIVTFQDHQYQSTTNMPGSGGTDTFIIKAASQGTCQLTIVQSRPWENSGPIAVFNVTITVNPSGST